MLQKEILSGASKGVNFTRKNTEGREDNKKVYKSFFLLYYILFRYMEEKMPKLSNYFGSDDCFLFKFISVGIVIGVALMWMVAS